MTTTIPNDDGPQLAPELRGLTHTLDANFTAFAVGDQVFRNAALEATKFIFDTSLNTEFSSIPHISQLLASLTPSEAPTTRASKKRKRAPSPLSARVTLKQTPLQELVVNELDENQLWAQLDLKAQGVCDMLDVLLEGEEDLEAERPLGMMPFLSSEDDPDGEYDDDESDSELHSLDSEEGSDEEGSGEDESEKDESIMELQDPSSDEDEEEEDIVVQPIRRREKHKRQESVLDDDFFNLSSFNAETELAEANFVSGGELAGDDEDEDDPVDLSINPGDSSEIYFYKDFFEPPAKQKQKAPHSKVRFREEVRVKKIDRRGRGLSVRALMRGEPGMGDDGDDFEEEFGEDDLEGLLPESQELDEPEESGSEDASAEEYDDREIVARMNQDLFEEDEDEIQQTDISTHEKRIAALQKQIAELEMENVGPKDWVLMGEANSRSRPQNSLLEEDLEFDRTVKVAPVTTTESVQRLEDRIKARILEGRFDDVVRVRPMDDKPFLPSRLIETQDTKSKQSLAQIYEEEYVAAQDGTTPGASRDAKLQQEHKEIEAVWEKICSKLDALCNAHFTPKQPKATITSIGNASSASVESALPTTMSAKTMLAPEEVFTPSSTDLRAKSEMTPREKKVLHNKQRKARTKARHQLEKSVDKFAKSKKVSTKKQKEAALTSMVKSGRGVTVVGKKSVSGKKDKISRS